MATTGSVLTFVIVGRDDHPIFEADLTSKASEVANRDVSIGRLWLKAASS